MGLVVLIGGSRVIRGLRVGVGVPVKQVMYRGATPECERRTQKKNANPSFHSSTTSFEFSFVKTT